MNININKLCQQTTTQRLIKHTPFVDWWNCYEKVCLLVVDKLVLHGKQFLLNGKGK